MEKDKHTKKEHEFRPHIEVEEEIEETKNCSARIKEISALGLLTIHFNATMSTDFNHTWLNETTLELYI